MRYRFPGIAIFVAALLACSSSAFAGPPSLDDGRGDPLIRITGLTPVASTKLTLGEDVTVEATVAYILHYAAGKVVLVVIDDAKHIVAQTSTDITEGTAAATLRLPFVVPASKMLTVKALLATSDGKPFARDSRTYTSVFAGPLAPVDSGAKHKRK